MYATLPRLINNVWTVNLHHDEPDGHHITTVETTSLATALDIRSRFVNSEDHLPTCSCCVRKAKLIINNAYLCAVCALKRMK